MFLKERDLLHVTFNSYKSVVERDHFIIFQKLFMYSISFFFKNWNEESNLYPVIIVNKVFLKSKPNIHLWYLKVNYNILNAQDDYELLLYVKQMISMEENKNFENELQDL